MLVVDRMALYLDAAFSWRPPLTLLFAPPYLREQGFEFGEFYALVLFGAAGMMMVAHAASLVTLLIGIETMSLAAYVLTGSLAPQPAQLRGAMKYFLHGRVRHGLPGLRHGAGLRHHGRRADLRRHRRARSHGQPTRRCSSSASTSC